MGHDDRVRAISLAIQQAVEVMERIGRGKLGRSIPPWMPLMAGAGDAAVVQKWARLAKDETNAQRCSEYAGLALVFMDWKGLGSLWKQTLEGFNVEQIDIVRQWKDAARLEEKRSNLLLVLRKRFATEAPADLTQTVQHTTDLQQLSSWFVTAPDSPSLEAFRDTMPADPGGTKPEDVWWDMIVVVHQPDGNIRMPFEASASYYAADVSLADLA